VRARLTGSRIGSARGPAPDPLGVTPRRQGPTGKSVRTARDECVLSPPLVFWSAWPAHLMIPRGLHILLASHLRCFCCIARLCFSDC
jgi:hypothetical protein